MICPPSHNLRLLTAARRVALTGLLLLILSPAAFTAETQLFLRNGDRVTGTVLTEDPARLTVSNAVLGVLTVPLAQVSRRVDPVPTPAGPVLDPETKRRLDDAQAAYVTGLLSGAEYHRQRARLLTQATLAQAASVAAVPLTQANTPEPPKPVMQFSGEVQAGLDLALATKDRQLYTGRIKLQQSYGRLRNTADYLFTYGRTDGELSANRMDGTIKSDYDLAGRIYGYHQGNAGYDEIRKLDNYWQVGPGAGWRAFSGTNFSLNLEAGFNFQEQNRSDGTDTDVFYYRLAESGKWALNSRLTLDQKLEYFPQWDTFQEFKLRFEGNLRIWLFGNLSLNLTLINLYDTMPAQGVDPNDLQIRSTVGIRF